MHNQHAIPDCNMYIVQSLGLGAGSTLFSSVFIFSFHFFFVISHSLCFLFKSTEFVRGRQGNGKSKCITFVLVVRKSSNELYSFTYGAYFFFFFGFSFDWLFVIALMWTVFVVVVAFIYFHYNHPFIPIVWADFMNAFILTLSNLMANTVDKIDLVHSF